MSKLGHSGRCSALAAHCRRWRMGRPLALAGALCALGGGVVSASLFSVLAAPGGSAAAVAKAHLALGNTSSAGLRHRLPSQALEPAVTAVHPDSGPSTGGIVMQISGTNLTGATAVDFGGSTGPFVVVSNELIVAPLPAHSPGTVDVTVRTPAGTSASTPADRFTYFAAPSVRAMYPDSGSSNGGTKVAIYGDNLTGATTVNFGDSPAPFTVERDDLIIADAPEHSPGVVDVIVRTPAARSPYTPADQFTYVAP